MSYLVDTNVFCEPVKRRPDAKVVAWLRANESSLFVSTITIGQMRRGIERLPAAAAERNFAGLDDRKALKRKPR